MAGPEFWQTRAGVKFLEITLPDLARSLERIANFLEKLDKKIERSNLEISKEED